MLTRVLPVDQVALDEAARLLGSGQIVAIPTETVYGLAADATNASAVARIYAAKGRPRSNPLIVHVADLAAATRLGTFSRTAYELAVQHWPGPMTLVVPARAGNDIAVLATAGLETIALRVSAHPVMRALSALVGPLAAPSANRSGTISPTSAAHVVRSLGDRIALLLDGGPCVVGLESTIVAFTGGPPRLLRPGVIQIDADSSEHGTIESPGQLARHYAPDKPVRLDATESGDDEWLIGFGPVSGQSTLSTSGNLHEAAACLFERLYQADAAVPPRIAVAPVPMLGIGMAINDRLRRAAA